MKIALPVSQGKLCMHFGHCEEFALYSIDGLNNISSKEVIEAPPHEPGLLPQWLSEKGATCIIAGGMGNRAQNLFADKNIQVVTGAMGENPEILVKAFLNNELKCGSNACDH